MLFINRLRTLFAILLVMPSSTFAAEPAVQKRAFLVGVAKYAKDGLADLEYCEDDMRALGAELTKQQFKVTTLLGREATGKRVNAALNTFIAESKELEKNDVVIVAFSGHGRQAQVARDGRTDEDAFFCPVDARATDPSTMLSISRLMEQLEAHSGSSQNLVLIDACRDNPGKGAKGIDGSTARRLPNKISILFSSSAGSRSFESSKVQHGVFTHLLLEGLRGEAANKRGQITWLSLADYVVNEAPIQTPKLMDNPSLIQEPNLMGNLVRQPVLARVAIVSRASGADRVATEDWQPLMQGQRLSQWKAFGTSDVWQIAPGEITAKGGRSQLFMTGETYSDFELKCEVKCDEAANGGIFFRSRPAEPFPRGYEAQVNFKHRDEYGMGSLYNFAHARRKDLPSDRWIELQLSAIGNRVVISVDGETVVDFVDEKNTYAIGQIGLQSHTSAVRYRNLMVRKAGAAISR